MNLVSKCQKNSFICLMCLIHSGHWQVHEPLALIVHHLPIAVTFAFITEDNILVRGEHPKQYLNPFRRCHLGGLSM